MNENRESSYDGADFTIERYSGNRYLCYPKGTDSNISMVALTDVTKTLNIPFPHRFIAFDYYHTDSSDVASNTEVDLTIRRTILRNIPRKMQVKPFYDEIFDAEASEEFGETFERPPAKYDITLQGLTTGDLVYLVVYIQKMED